MLSTQDARDLIVELLEEQALLIGGIVSTHDVDDRVVGHLMRGLGDIRRRVLARIEEAESPPPLKTLPPHGTTPHSAIELFLREATEQFEFVRVREMKSAAVDRGNGQQRLFGDADFRSVEDRFAWNR